MRIRFVPSDNYGGGHLRSIWPADELRRRGFDAICKPWWPVAEEHDVVIIHRPLSRSAPAKIAQYKQAGLRVLVDEDDYLEAIPDAMPAKGDLWSDELARRHEHCIREADGVIVTTLKLAQEYSAWRESFDGLGASDVFICPNFLPETVRYIRWHWMPRTRRDVFIGWTGTTRVHAHDLLWLRPAAERMTIGALFECIGDTTAPSVLGVQGSTFPYCEIDECYKLMARCDVGIVPLLPCEFNEAKSWLKALEYMTLGKPVVATNLPEQAKLIEHGISGFLADTADEFADYVQALVNDPALRQSMGQAASERARRFTIEQRGSCWEQVLPVTVGG
jgi:glycosyltransferase involved in cell wall biosynthesis